MERVTFATSETLVVALQSQACAYNYYSEKTVPFVKISQKKKYSVSVDYVMTDQFYAKWFYAYVDTSSLIYYTESLSMYLDTTFIWSSDHEPNIYFSPI